MAFMPIVAGDKTCILTTAAGVSEVVTHCEGVVLSMRDRSVGVATAVATPFTASAISYIELVLVLKITPFW